MCGLENHDYGTVWIGSSAGGALGIAAALLPSTRRTFAMCAADIHSPAKDLRFIVAQRSATPATKYTSGLLVERAYPGRNCSRPSMTLSGHRSRCPHYDARPVAQMRAIVRFG